LVFYVNCTFDTNTSQTDNLNIDSTSYVTTIGAYHDGGTKLDASIDEFAMWGRALTGAEISQLYAGYNPYFALVEFPAISINTSLNVNGNVFANDYITKSKVLDYKELNYAEEYYENIDLWLNDDKSINYDKHPSKRKIKEYKDLVPVYETTCNDVWNIINLTFNEVCTTETTGYSEESVIEYGLSMETRVAELERIVYNLILQVNKVKGDIKK